MCEMITIREGHNRSGRILTAVPARVSLITLDNLVPIISIGVYRTPEAPNDSQ